MENIQTFNVGIASFPSAARPAPRTERGCGQRGARLRRRGGAAGARSSPRSWDRPRLRSGPRGEEGFTGPQPPAGRRPAAGQAAGTFPRCAVPVPGVPACPRPCDGPVGAGWVLPAARRAPPKFGPAGGRPAAWPGRGAPVASRDRSASCGAGAPTPASAPTPAPTPIPAPGRAVRWHPELPNPRRAESRGEQAPSRKELRFILFSRGLVRM